VRGAHGETPVRRARAQAVAAAPSARGTGAVRRDARGRGGAAHDEARHPARARQASDRSTAVDARVLHGAHDRRGAKTFAARADADAARGERAADDAAEDERTAATFAAPPRVAAPPPVAASVRAAAVARIRRTP